jgi:hypothetical protein
LTVERLVKIKPSAIGGCYKRVVYESLGYEPAEPDAHSKIVMGMGNALEGLVLDNVGYPVGERQLAINTQDRPFEGNWYLSLKVDGIAKDPLDLKGKYVVEVKAMGAYPWKHAKDKGILEASFQYALQGACYWKATGADGVIFELLNRDSGFINRQIISEQNLLTSLWLEVVARATMIAEHVNAGTIPDKPEGLPKWACKGKYCSMKFICPHITK